eukprot:6663388-Pyramimonas_sp.AAC.1
MDVGRGAADYDPLVSYPHYANNVQVVCCVHRDRISWMSDDVWWSQIRHALSLSEHDFRFPPKGKASKNKGNNYRAAHYAGRGRGRSRSPRGGEGQTGGSAPSSPRPPTPPTGDCSPFGD